MKHFFFNCQAKGGSGKSILTYLQALKNEFNPKTGFIDLDSSTKTSTRQLKFLGKEGQPDRMFTIDIFDTNKKIERERLIEIIEHFNQTSFDDIYIDFGAPESEQLPHLIKLDYDAKSFKEFEKEFSVKFVFNVVLAGGTSYESSFEYLKIITSVLKGDFDIVIYANMFTFKDYNQQLDQLNLYAKKQNSITKVIQWGNIQTDRVSGQKIIELIRKGSGWEGYKNSWMARTKMKKLLAELP